MWYNLLCLGYVISMALTVSGGRCSYATTENSPVDCPAGQLRGSCDVHCSCSQVRCCTACCWIRSRRIWQGLRRPVSGTRHWAYGWIWGKENNNLHNFYDVNTNALVIISNFKLFQHGQLTPLKLCTMFKCCPDTFVEVVDCRGPYLGRVDMFTIDRANHCYRPASDAQVHWV